MDAYIPIANNQTLFPEVLNSLTEHYMIENVWIHPTKSYTKGKERYKYIAENRLGIFRHAVKVGEEFFIMTNSDIVHNGIEIPTMYNFLIKNPAYGAVGYHPKRRPATCKHMHVGTGLMVVRTEAVINLKMYIKKHHKCDCHAFCEEMRAFDWKVDYVGYDKKAKPIKYLN